MWATLTSYCYSTMELRKINIPLEEGYEAMFKTRWKITEFHQKLGCSMKILTKKMYFWMSTTKLKTTFWSWRDAQWSLFKDTCFSDRGVKFSSQNLCHEPTTVCNSISRGSDAPLCPLQAGHLCAHTHIQIHKHINTNEINLKIKPPINPVTHKMLFPQHHIKLVLLN